MNNTLHASGLRFTSIMENSFGKIDHVRIYEADRIITADQKERRQINRYKKKRKLDAFRHCEGTLYKSGKFHNRAKVSSSGKCAPNVANFEKGKLSTAAPLTSGYIAVNKQDLITTHRTRFARQL